MTISIPKMRGHNRKLIINKYICRSSDLAAFLNEWITGRTVFSLYLCCTSSVHVPAKYWALTIKALILFFSSHFHFSWSCNNKEENGSHAESYHLKAIIFISTYFLPDFIQMCTGFYIIIIIVHMLFLKKLIYFIFHWVGSSLLHTGFSLVVTSRGYSSLQCAGFSLWWLLLLWSTGSRHVGFSSCGAWAQ